MALYYPAGSSNSNDLHISAAGGPGTSGDVGQAGVIFIDDAYVWDANVLLNPLGLGSGGAVASGLRIGSLTLAPDGSHVITWEHTGTPSTSASGYTVEFNFRPQQHELDAPGRGRLGPRLDGDAPGAARLLPGAGGTMRRGTITKSVTAFLVAAASSALAGEWSVGAGPVYRGGMDLEMSGSSYVQSAGLHAARPARRATGSDPAGPLAGTDDDITAFRDRSFDDGYVFLDPNTAAGDGLTWYWGYESAGQYDAGADTLAFTRQGAEARSTTRTEQTTVRTLMDEVLQAEEDLDGWGAQLTAAYSLGGSPGCTLSLEAGLLGLWNLKGGASARPYAEQVETRRSEVTRASASREVYTYDLPVDPFSGEPVVPPAAPHRGTLDGPGPLIPNLPASRETTAAAGTVAGRSRTSSYTAYNEVEVDVCAELYALWLGPRMDCSAGERVTFFLRPLVSLNALNVSAERTEVWRTDTQVLDSWHDRVDETEWLWGAGLHAGLDVRVGATWSVGAFGGYDWVDEAQVGLGPNRVSLDPSGYSIGLEVRKTFGKP